LADSTEGLLLVIRNEHPIRAADFAQLFSDLAKDYKRISNGRDLVITRISQGSLLTLLHDAAGVFGDVNSLVTFGKTLAALTVIALGASAGASKLLNSRKAGTQTIKSLAKMAFESDAEVEMQYQRSWGKEDFFLRLTPADARQIQQATDEKSASVKTRSLIAPEKQKVLGAAQSREIKDALVRIAERGDESVSDLQAIIDAIVGILGIHSSTYVFEIVAELEGQGHIAVAQLLRDAFERSTAGRNSIPPLLA
jgi:hypothetical protein